MAGILDGVRVLDFGRYVAGPYCATVLGDFGAEVIRIERRSGSEDRFVTPVTEGGEGSLFMQVARNKLSVTLDPMNPAATDVVRRLVESADIVVANLPGGTLKAMGLDYETLKAIKPNIILVNVSAFLGEGPWADRLGFDTIGQAMSGGVHLSGQPDQPYRATVSWVDFGTALHAALGAVLALIERGKSGRGQEVKAALLPTAVSFNNGALIEQAVIAPNRVATGNRSPTSGPTDMYRAKDGKWLLTQVVGLPLFKRWARLMGEDKWLEDPRFADDIGRGDHGPELSARTAKWCLEHDRDEALDLLAAAKIPAGPILSPQEVLDHPQVQALKLLHALDYPGLPKPAPVAQTAIFMSETPAEIRSAAPELGAHTDQILSQLGYSAEEIAGLRQSGSI
ncbi:CaiB/BaiF CoA-transferase family protein [Phenylobacterium sp.]|uniref:CaiB/BaiF CoA transferase family protein n=1 Tax=Phenylobacterium sp. TaxID=1871053 RepID=UPI002734637C|nr:CoA transferase [Phenylobacterium sp.]MDP3661013.1 CoA transferase [Phenylobacterium sp.]